MRLIKTLAFITIAVLLSACSDSQPTYHDTQGDPVKLSSYKGDWIVVNYWAKWCGSCVEEIPQLNQLSHDPKYPKIKVIGVNFDHEPAGMLKKDISGYKIQYPVLLEDPAEAWHLRTVDVLPTTFIIDPTGHVATMLVGPNTEASLVKTIDGLSHGDKQAL